jgi:transposase
MSPAIRRLEVVYPSDLTAAQFEMIRPLLQSARKKTSPRRVDLHHVFNAVVYLLREGCRWRSLPKDFPEWNICYYYYRIWRDHIDSETNQPLLELVLKKIGRRRARPRWA